ncbi:hypothetical protein QFC22_001691 [Naganishia vaughanmartiniae]|uniref:Uncharacterized protein n=1 Tax=Naganishia vaughanmartiniae TaxID=1424756 RepID=A0ACC2XF59_9TREE|nr:hypothetical protein QFC22_001691 [Naganishia vaughanmartiniae]
MSGIPPHPASSSNIPAVGKESSFTASRRVQNPALQDSSLVDPLDTSKGISTSTSGMTNGPSSDAIFAWRDKQARKQDAKIKDQQQQQQQRGPPSSTEFSPPPPFVFSPVSQSHMIPGEKTAAPARDGQGRPPQSLQGVLDSLRHRRRSSAASMRSELWKQHDQSALDTASLASEEIHPSNLHPFDDNATSIPKLNQISPSPVNLPSVLELEQPDTQTRTRDYANIPSTKMQLRGMRRRSSGGSLDGSETGRPDGAASATLGGLTATRPHLTALSPLQSFSPLHPLTDSPGGAGGSRSRTHSRTPSWQSSGSQSAALLGASAISPIMLPQSAGLQLSTQNLSSNTAVGPKTPGTGDDNAEKQIPATAGLSRSRSNASSVTRSLSRRQSFAASRASISLTEQNSATGQGIFAGGSGSGLHAHQGGLISKLLIVKAPSKGTEKGKLGDEVAGNKARTRSSGSLTPFSASGGPALMTPISAGPAQLPSSPSRSFAIPIRGASSYNGPSSAGGFMGTPGARTSFLFDPGYHESAMAPANIHDQKMLSPEQVVEIAEGLKSPVMKNDEEDAFFPSSLGGKLSRNSSYSRRNHKRSGSGASLNKGSFNRGRFSGDLSFTPQDEEVRAPPTPASAQVEPMELEPMDYLEMSDDCFLPYVDRPTEVAELLELPSSYDLLEVIRPTFPTESVAKSSDPEAWRLVKPEEWTWDEFRNGHLMVSRAESDDFDWIRKARQAIRARSECLWERFGLLLGVDPEMMNMGEEYEDVFAPGGALGDVFDSDATSPSLSIASPAVFMSYDDRFGFIGDENARDQVWVEGLEANGSPSSFDAGKEDSAAASFGDRKARLSDDASASAGLQLSGTDADMRSASPLLGASGGMETIGEGEEEGGLGRPAASKAKMTPAQRAAAEATEDPFGKMSPPLSASAATDSPLASSPLARSAPTSQKPRTKSFVGLQIYTMPSLPTTLPNHDFQRDRDHSGFQQTDLDMPHMERGPGNPLFPASFARLSLAPTLPNNNPALKRASMLAANNAGQGASSGSGSQASTPKMGNGRPPWSELTRRKSRGGLSESALTLTSEDDHYGNF